MKHCEICGKTSLMANKRKKLRGNYNPVNRLRKYPNLQKTSHEGIKVTACTQCIKTKNKVK